jgi:hypothetical protein
VGPSSLSQPEMGGALGDEAGRLPLAAIPNSSRMNREVPVRFLEGPGVKFPGPTRLRRFGVESRVRADRTLRSRRLGPDWRSPRSAGKIRYCSPIRKWPNLRLFPKPSLVHDGDAVAMEGFTHLIPYAAGHEIILQGRPCGMPLKGIGPAPWRIRPNSYDEILRFLLLWVSNSVPVSQLPT